MFDVVLTMASDLFFVIFEWLKSLNWAETLSFLSSLGVMIGIFLGLKSLAQQKKDLSSNVNWKSRLKSLDYSRSNCPKYDESQSILEGADMFKEYYKKIKKDRSTTIPIAIIKEKKDAIKNIVVLLAHWENLALAIDVSVADEETAKAMTRTNVINTMTLYSEFIKEEKGAAPGKYDHLIRLATKWHMARETKNRDKNPLKSCVPVLSLGSSELSYEDMPKTPLVEKMFEHVTNPGKT